MYLVGFVPLNFVQKCRSENITLMVLSMVLSLCYTELPAEKILVQNLIGEKVVAKFDSLSLSNDTVKRRIIEMSVDIADEVTLRIRSIPVWLCYSG